MRDAKQYGIKVNGEIEPDWAAMQKRKVQIAGRLTKGVGALLKRAKVDCFEWAWPAGWRERGRGDGR